MQLIHWRAAAIKRGILQSRNRYSYFSLTSTKYNEKTYASYMPSGWYKNLWRFMSTPIFDLEVTEDYEDLPVLRERDVYLMEAFVDGGFQNADLKSLNFVRKYIQAVTLADIATADSSRISHQSYKGLESNGLRKDLTWPKVPTKEQMPPAFITLWKSALNKCFINHASGINRRISTGLSLGNWVDQDVGGKWVWWPVPGESRIYHRNNENWSYYRQAFAAITC